MAQAALISHLPILKKHRTRLRRISMRAQFAKYEKRAQTFSLTSNGLLYDYSKNRFDQQSLTALINLASTAKVEKAREAMFAGKKINFTENRAVLHTALRAKNSDALIVDGTNIRPIIEQAKIRLFAFADDVRNGGYKISGGAVTDVVNIGIGGSDLGPAMCAQALAPYHDGPNTHFVSNVDSADFYETTKTLNPDTTLFIIASKSFTTAETMANAALAKAWLSRHIPSGNIGRHFVALSTNLTATGAFGIEEARTFGFWDWVGGRYSIWSSIALSLIIAIGPHNYQKFLDGGSAADQHFCNADLDHNIPVLMALLGIWHRNVWNFPTHTILPYDNRLQQLPAYLQQLDMESNGKHVCTDASNSAVETGPIIWGDAGTNGQHAFYQMLHQGTNIVPCDFLVAANSHEKDQSHQRILAANCFAQSQAMMAGRIHAEAIESLQSSGRSKNEIARLAPHKVFAGNRPSSTFLYEKLTPFVLGQLIAFYEHKVFVQGIIWGINSFDQWGVELGKKLATQIQPLLEHQQIVPPQIDASSARLIEKFHQLAAKQK